MFKIKVRIQGRLEWLTWDDGKLFGRPYLVDSVKAEAKLRAKDYIGPVGGPYTRGARQHLLSGLSVLHLLRGMEGVEVGEATGDVPEPPDTPPGAIV